MVEQALPQDLFLLVGFLLTSAHGLYGEPAGYGPFRLLDAARRLVALMAEHGLADPYLVRLQEALEAACTGTASDDELCQLVDQLVLQYAGELRARLPMAGSGN